MADWDTIRDTENIPNGFVTSKVDPNAETLPQAYTNPAFRHSTGPVHVSSDRFNTAEKHLMENHLVYDKRKHSIFEDADKIHRQNGSIAIRKVYKETNGKKYATTRLPSEGVALNPVNLNDLRKSPAFMQRNVIQRHSAPVYGRSRPRSPRHYGVSEGRQWSGTFVRHRKHERKEECVAFFDIETDRVEKYQYRPGEEVSGAIKIIVKQNFEIKFVELVVVGQGFVTVRNVKDGIPKTVKETYLRKQTYVIGTGDFTWTSVLTAGHYTSKFRVKLPLDLPSSFHHDDPNNGFSFEVKYSLTARICDDVSRASARSTSSIQSAGPGHNLMRVILSKTAIFYVQRPFDIHTIPTALDPVVHTENLWLACAHQYAAIVSVQLDRSVFLAGDDIRMELTASVPGSQRVKDISCSLQEHLALDANSEPVTFTLSRMICQDPDSPGRKKSSEMEENTYDVTIPTQTNLISSFSVSKIGFKVTYSLVVTLKFSNSGGKLSFKIPIGIGPCAEPIYAEKVSTRKFVPLFNRTTRFPCFSSTPPTGSSTPRNLSARSGSSNSIPVVTKYSNSIWSRCFLCCLATTKGDDD